MTAVTALVKLPEYLGRAQGLKKDVRGGAVALVKGSMARFAATASRDLASAQVDNASRIPSGATFQSPDSLIKDSRSTEFRWIDRLGLAGKAPFHLALTARDDEPPSLSCEDLPRRKVVLDSEQLAFQVRATDDFGVRRVGLEWEGEDDPNIKTPAKGEKVLAAGGNDRESLDLRGTFSAKSLGIAPQAVKLRVFAEDYFPGRPRVYSPTYVLYVLDPEQHAIWLTEQLSKWHRNSLEVRDREMQLHETNAQLRLLSPLELDRPETRRRIENQAAAEQANGRRLANLVVNGEDLIKQATRNPEFGVGHLEKWAQMLQILKDIASNRMPSVADLLKGAAQAPMSPPTSGMAKMAGAVRAGGGGSPAQVKPSKVPTPLVPQVVDRESSQQPPDKTRQPAGRQEEPVVAQPPAPADDACRQALEHPAAGQ